MNNLLRSSRILLIALTALLLISLSGCEPGGVGREDGPPVTDGVESPPSPDRSAEDATSGFVGVERCTGCHPDEGERWRGSHHDRAMEVATEESISGAFDGRSLDHFDRHWRFQRDGEFYVVELREGQRPVEQLVVGYTFGVYPLQQYLVERTDGRWQALPVAWDARPEDEGGQRWFVLQPEEPAGPGDPLHWEELAYNWNSQCASCHSTQLQKGFDAEANRFDTHWVEIDVGCEACHGPGAQHVARHRNGERQADIEGDVEGEGTRAHSSESEPAADSEGLIHFEAWDSARWVRQEDARIARRAVPRLHDKQLDTCGPCHSRRSELVARPDIGAPLLDGYAPSLVEPGLYFDDGQIRDEVYVWGSFEQSRMFAAGVRCADCHDPHSLTLRREGNALCNGCHDASSYDVAAHRGHAQTEMGPNCVDCHMPTRVYMEIDGRRDHSFPIPRPARSEALGSPDACQGCHVDRDSNWAETAIAVWRGDRRSPAHWSDSLMSGERARTDPMRWLEIALDGSHPGIVRGSAWSRYAQDANVMPPSAVLEERLQKGSDLEVLGVIEAARRLAPSLRISLLKGLLDHERRAIRVAAGDALSDVPVNLWRPNDRAALARVLREYRSAQEASAERPAAQVNLGLMAMGYGDPVAARAAYERAIERSPYFVPAYVNLADLERVVGDEAEAIRRLREALAIEPGAAFARHALGLALYRQGDAESALAELERAAREEPDAARFTLAWALAVDGAGRRGEALEILSDSVDRGVGDGEVRYALVTLLREEGEFARARQRARAWRDLDPTDPRPGALLEELGGE